MTYREFLNEFFVTVGYFTTFYYSLVVLTYIFIITKIRFRKRKACNKDK